MCDAYLYAQSNLTDIHHIEILEYPKFLHVCEPLRLHPSSRLLVSFQICVTANLTAGSVVSRSKSRNSMSKAICVNTSSADDTAVSLLRQTKLPSHTNDPGKSVRYVQTESAASNSTTTRSINKIAGSQVFPSLNEQTVEPVHGRHSRTILEAQANFLSQEKYGLFHYNAQWLQCALYFRCFTRNTHRHDSQKELHTPPPHFTLAVVGIMRLSHAFLLSAGPDREPSVLPDRSLLKGIASVKGAQWAVCL